jgi:hypothetical protein
VQPANADCSGHLLKTTSTGEGWRFRFFSEGREAADANQFSKKDRYCPA